MENQQKNNFWEEEIHLLYHYWKTQPNVVYTALESDLRDKTSTVILSAIYNKDKEMLKFCLEKGANLSYPHYKRKHVHILSLLEIEHLQWLIEEFPSLLEQHESYNQRGEGLLAKFLSNNILNSNNLDNYNKFKLMLKIDYPLPAHLFFSNITLFINYPALIDQALADNLFTQEETLIPDQSGESLIKKLFKQKIYPVLLNIAHTKNCNIFEEPNTLPEIIAFLVKTNPTLEDVIKNLEKLFSKYMNKNIVFSLEVLLGNKTLPKDFSNTPSYEVAQGLLKLHPKIHNFFTSTLEKNKLISQVDSSFYHKKNIL